jgi:heme/copper-type cytochrome/quinol oxidase subunit 3
LPSGALKTSSDAAVGALNAGGGRVQKEDVMNEWTNAKLCDVANLILGVILLASPWIFGFPSGAASQNAVTCGIVIAAISLAALAAFTVWEEWLNLIVGVWVLVSPWVLGFVGTTAMHVHIVVGVIVAVLAALEIWLLYQRPPRHTAAN